MSKAGKKKLKKLITVFFLLLVHQDC